jgi:hypothetical protein
VPICGPLFKFRRKGGVRGRQRERPGGGGGRRRGERLEKEEVVVGRGEFSGRGEAEGT